MLGRGETIIWTYNGVTMYQRKDCKRIWRKKKRLVNCVMKGLTYHIGGTKNKTNRAQLYG